MKPYLANELHEEQVMGIISSPFLEQSDPMWPSPLFPLEVMLLAWSPLGFAVLAVQHQRSVHLQDALAC